MGMSSRPIGRPPAQGDGTDVYSGWAGAIRRTLSHPPGIVRLGSSPAARRPPPYPGSTSEVAVSCLIPFPVAEPVDDEPLWWFGHDDVDRLFDDATMLCPCLDCTEALRREAVRRPRRPMGLKTGGDRIVVTAEYLVEVLAVDDSLEPLFYLPDDYLREIYVVDLCWPLRRRARWSSLSCEE